jgi:hypothetical protein
MDKISVWTTQSEVAMHAKYVCEYAETCNRVWAKAIELLRTKCDGKQLNKRFADALNAAFENELYTFYDGRKVPNINVSIRTSYGDNKEIAIWLQQRCYNYNNRACYYDGNVWGKYVALDKKYFEDGKVVAHRLIPAIERVMGGNRVLIYKLQDAAKNFDKYRAAYEKAKSAFITACEKINPMFVEDDVRTYISYNEWRMNMQEQLNIH